MMSKFSWKKTRPPAKLLHQEVASSDWITNFWVIDDQLYLTDAKFNSEPKLLAVIPLVDLEVNISKKGVLNQDFLKHPHPMFSSFLEASQTAITTVDYFDAYLYNLVLVDGYFYLSLIQNDRSGSYVLKFDQNWKHSSQIEAWKDYVLIGTFLDGLLLQTLTSKQTYLWVNGEFQIFGLTHVSQVVQSGDAYFFTTLDYGLYWYEKTSRKFQLIKQFNADLSLSGFDASSVLVSVEQEQATYYVKGEKYDQFNFLTKWYFYRLGSWKKQLLIGKPLHLTPTALDYDQPLIFIK